MEMRFKTYLVYMSITLYRPNTVDPLSYAFHTKVVAENENEAKQNASESIGKVYSIGTCDRNGVANGCVVFGNSNDNVMQCVVHTARKLEGE